MTCIFFKKKIFTAGGRVAYWHNSVQASSTMVISRGECSSKLVYHLYVNTLKCEGQTVKRTDRQKADQSDPQPAKCMCFAKGIFLLNMNNESCIDQKLRTTLPSWQTDRQRDGLKTMSNIV